MFPVSVMILVMVVLGGMGSVYGVVIGAVILQLLQSWFLQDLTQWMHALGRLLGNDWLQRLDLVLADRADLRHHPGGDDAVPPTRTDPGDARRRAAHARAAGGAAVARRHQCSAALGSRRPRPSRRWRCSRRTAARVRRPHGARRGRPDGRRAASVARDRARTDRASRPCSTLITGLVQPDGGSIRFDGEDITGPAGRIAIARTRHRPHLPEHPPVPQPDGAGERDDRRACAHHDRRGRRRAAPAVASRRGGAGARAGDRDPRRSSATGCCRAPHQLVSELVLRQSPARRDRPRAGLAAASSCCSTSRPPA